MAISPPAFAVAGMAGMVGGSTGAALAAIVMIFEMTLDYRVIIPMTITVAISYGVRKVVCSESIYTLKLVRRGHYMPDALQTNAHFLKRASELMDRHFLPIPASTPLDEVAALLEKDDATAFYLVVDGDKVKGILTRERVQSMVQQNEKSATVGEAQLMSFVIVAVSSHLIDIVECCMPTARPLRWPRTSLAKRARLTFKASSTRPGYSIRSPMICSSIMRDPVWVRGGHFRGNQSDECPVVFPNAVANSWAPGVR